MTLGLLAGGCGRSAQQTGFDHAVTMEQQLPADRASAVIAEYQKVIQMEPESALAKQARARLDAVRSRVRKADELHKSVFQETGID